MIDLITGHTGTQHVTAKQIADINNAMMAGYGNDKVMRLSGGEIGQTGVLEITISEGLWRVNGFDMEIQEAETVAIDPCMTSAPRIDRLFVEILQDIPTGFQRSEIVVIKGTENSHPVAPNIPTDPESGTDLLLEVIPLANVFVDGSSIYEFTDLTIEYQTVNVESLNNKADLYHHYNIATGNAMGALRASNQYYGHVRLLDDFKGTEYSSNVGAADGVGASLKAVQDAYNDLKQSFTDGCNGIATALINKGVTPTKAANTENYTPTDFINAINVLLAKRTRKVAYTITTSPNTNGTSTYSHTIKIGNVTKSFNGLTSLSWTQQI